MEFALGVLRWTPDAFWRSTPLELTSAYVGYCRREGLGRWQRDEAGFMFEDVEDMLGKFRAAKAARGDGRKLQMTKEQKRTYNQLREQGGVMIRV